MAQRDNRMYGGTNFWKLWNPSSFQISKMEAFLGKWKMDYDACEGYDEFMAAEVLPSYSYYFPKSYCLNEFGQTNKLQMYLTS